MRWIYELGTATGASRSSPTPLLQLIFPLSVLFPAPTSLLTFRKYSLQIFVLFLRMWFIQGHISKDWRLYYSLWIIWWTSYLLGLMVAIKTQQSDFFFTLLTSPFTCSVGRVIAAQCKPAERQNQKCFLSFCKGPLQRPPFSSKVAICHYRYSKCMKNKLKDGHRHACWSHWKWLEKRLTWVLRYLVTLLPWVSSKASFTYTHETMKPHCQVCLFVLILVIGN